MQTGVQQATPTTSGSATKTGSHRADGTAGKKVASGGSRLEGSTIQEDPAAALAIGPTEAPGPRDPLPLLLYIVAAIVAVLAIFGPAAVTAYLRRQRARIN